MNGADTDMDVFTMLAAFAELSESEKALPLVIQEGQWEVQTHEKYIALCVPVGAVENV